MADTIDPDNKRAILAACLDSVPSAVLVTDGERVVFANARTRALFRCADGSTIDGLSVSEIVHPDGHETMRQRGQVLRAARVSLRNLPVKLRALDGSPFTLIATGTRVDCDGTRVYLFTEES